jgi:hypothetical protein
MKLLLRMAFWLGIVVMLLPASPSGGNSQPPRVSAGEALSAAGAALADLRRFCGRQPGACTTGSDALKLFGEKARTGVTMLQTFLNEKLGADEGSPEAATHASRPGPASKAAHDTLLPADLIPAWRGPAPRVPIPVRRPT